MTMCCRWTAQLLAGERPRDPVSVAERLLAVQAQDLRAARLAVRARSEGLAASDVDRALTDERTLVVTWLNRGTLHLVRSEDLAWLHALTAPTLSATNARRLRQEGVSEAAAERAVAAIERALADSGPLTRDELREHLARARAPVDGQAVVHVLLLASLRGLVVRGPVAGADQAYVLVRDWLGEPAPVDRDAALAELARRYLAGHGPAGERDLARWSGLPLRDARAGLREAGAAPERRAAEPPPPRLLGGFEPVLLGWESRDEILGRHAGAVVSGGIFRPFALVRGRARALWRLRRGEVELEPLERLSRAEREALGAEAEDVARFLGA
jgi:hypothetical protein